MANTSTLTVRILGNASNAIQEVGKLNTVIGSLGKGALIAGGALGAAGIAAGTALFAIGNQFDQLENTIIKGTGATGDALEGLVDSAKNVLATVPDSSDVVAGALADVNTFFGLAGEDAEEATGLFLDFARVTGADLTTAIGGVDAAFTQFGEDARNMNDVLGDFTRISQATGAPVDQLIGQMETFGPLFSNAGFSIEETAAVFGQLEQAGVSVTRIGPGLNRFFREAAENGEDPRLALEGMVSAIGDAETSAEALNIATDAFGSEGAQRMANAIRSGNFDLEDFNGLLGDGRGLVGEQAEATESFSDKLSTLKNQVLVALAPAAEVAFEAIGDAIDALQPYIDQFGVWFAEQLPIWIENVQGVLQKWGPIVIGAVKSFVDFISDNWPTISAVITTVIDTIVTAFEDYLIPAATFVLEEVFIPILEWVEENWPQIEAVIVAVLDGIVLAFETVTTVVSTLWGIFGDYIIDVINIVVDTIIPVIAGAFEIITSVFEIFKGIFSGDWALLWDGITGVFSGAWAIASAVIEGAFNLLVTTLGLILDGLVATITGVWDGIVTEVSGLGSRVATAAIGLFDGIKDAFKSAVNFVIDGWNAIEFAIPGFSLGPVSFDGFSLGVPDIPRLATGGAAFAPMLAVVGDNPGAGSGDPEIVAPQSFIREAVRDVLAEFGGGVGGGTIINQEITGYQRPRDLGEDSAEAFRRVGNLRGASFAFAGDRDAA